MKIAAVYIVSTDMGDFLFDENLMLLPGESIQTLKSSIVLTFQQEAFASSENWEEWFAEYDKTRLMLKIQELIKNKMRQLTRYLDSGHKH